MEQKQFIQFQEGWDYMEKGITKLKRILEGESEQFRSDEYMHLYSKIYNMCTQKPPYEYSKLLYEGDEGVFVEYTNSTVLPSLREKHGEFMLG